MKELKKKRKIEEVEEMIESLEEKNEFMCVWNVEHAPGKDTGGPGKAEHTLSCLEVYHKCYANGHETIDL